MGQAHERQRALCDPDRSAALNLPPNAMVSTNGDWHSERICLKRPRSGESNWRFFSAQKDTGIPPPCNFQADAYRLIRLAAARCLFQYRARFPRRIRLFETGQGFPDLLFKRTGLDLKRIGVQANIAACPQSLTPILFLFFQQRQWERTAFRT